MPQIGLEGQIKLKNAKVLIIGAGGLGSPVSLYLAGAGIGHIGIMDADAVSLSNLQRQIAHSISTEGVNKALSAQKSMMALNDQIEVTSYPFRLTSENAEEIISKYDFVIDACDNFETKFLINDACVLMKKPFCHAGILGFEGQVMTWIPGDYPCYRCIFEEIPEKGSVPNCSQAGIIGAVAGIAGSVQALEAVKYFTGAGELLTGKLFTFNGLTMRTRIVPFSEKNSECRVCSENADIKNLSGKSDYYGCSVCSQCSETPKRSLTVSELNALDKESFQIIDIRSKQETAFGSIPGSVWINPDDINENDFPDRTKLLVICCARGEHSVQVAESLSEKGFNAVSLEGGFNEWLRNSFV